jgi:hypothetical protein
MSNAYPDKKTELSFNNPSNEPQVAVDGFGQILEMLRVADPQFRESLLKRLAARDRQLAQDLRSNLSV